ncbi:MAG TPA: hypothetical protein VM286_04715 [Candidatus Thermoplasmatota archaeon]|nr:hypothetical protein [Candidatus Thermoplasmatota archaeon]
MRAMFRPGVLLTILLLLGLSVPASADPDPCMTAQCIRLPDPRDAPGCDPVEFTGGEPRLQLHPLLNMVNIDLSCLGTKMPVRIPPR